MAMDDRMSGSTTLDPARMIAEARRAFFTMVGVLGVIWLVQLANWADDYRLTGEYGIRAQHLDRLPDLLGAPFLHVNWEHLEGNSGPLFVFGFLAAYRGVKKFLALTLLVALTSGAAVWLFEAQNVVTVGASGVIYGYFGYVVLRGIFDRNLIDTLIGVVMGASFAYTLTATVPGTPGVSWLGHLGGLLGGLAGAWIFRDRAGRTAAGAGSTRAGAGTPRPDAVPAQAPSTRDELLKELKDLGL
ncbi:rhomboid family intramembrane serine protease [Kitasatospora sp. NPDC050543]|uniref:rhomboid family intramembrane serine protease n=1 Tax=Kitasatospora sp. NPDC050543 TaxID=3364054 RepID=UPI0037AF3218